MVIISKEKQRSGDFLLIQYQILQASIIKIVRQIVRRITYEILGVKGLRPKLRNFRNSNLLKMRTTFLIVAVFVLLCFTVDLQVCEICQVAKDVLWQIRKLIIRQIPGRFEGKCIRTFRKFRKKNISPNVIHVKRRQYEETARLGLHFTRRQFIFILNVGRALSYSSYIQISGSLLKHPYACDSW